MRQVKYGKQDHLILNRKCLFGKFKNFARSRLNCGDAGIVRGCKVVTDVNDKSCYHKQKN